MPKGSAQMTGVQGGSVAVHQTQAEAQHEAKTRKLQDIAAALA